MRKGLSIAMFVALILLRLHAASADSPATTTTTPTSTRALGASTSTIPPDVLDSLYRQALGERYASVSLDDVNRAHGLVEDYFADNSAQKRKEIVHSLESLKLDANVIGRIVHIRMHWPELQGGGVFYINERFGPYDVKYFLGVPEKYDRTRAWPLVIKLPTAGPFVTEPPPSADDVSALYAGWIRDELQRHPDAIVLMPLLNLNDLYGPSYAGMNSVIQPMLHAADRVNIDPARVYLIGHAMAAHAVWNIGLHYTTYFAAINPMAGSASADWQRTRLMNLRNVLPVVWHDVTDDVIKVDASRSLVKILRGMKLDVDYTETNGAGHAPTDELAEDLYKKTTARVRDLYPQQVSLQSNRPDTMFNRLDWVQIYQPTRPGAERRLLFRRGVGHMIVYQNTFKVEAARVRQNRVEVVTDNVATMRFYFNDETLDFSRPLGIVVNKKTRFEGLVTPSIDEMLKDQLFLGRGWRYFTGIVDVDLDPKPATKPSTTKASTRPTTHKSDE